MTIENIFNSFRVNFFIYIFKILMGRKINNEYLVIFERCHIRSCLITNCDSFPQNLHLNFLFIDCSFKNLNIDITDDNKYIIVNTKEESILLNENVDLKFLNLFLKYINNTKKIKKIVFYTKKLNDELLINWKNFLNKNTYKYDEIVFIIERNFQLINTTMYKINQILEFLRNGNKNIVILHDLHFMKIKIKSGEVSISLDNNPNNIQKYIEVIKVYKNIISNFRSLKIKINLNNMNFNHFLFIFNNIVNECNLNEISINFYVHKCQNTYFIINKLKLLKKKMSIKNVKILFNINFFYLDNDDKKFVFKASENYLMPSYNLLQLMLLNLNS